MFILVSHCCVGVGDCSCARSQTKVADLVQIAPQDFAKKSLTAVEDNINTKFANKVGMKNERTIYQESWRLSYYQVIQGTGLCICLYDLLWASEGLIGHGDGLVNVNGAWRGSNSAAPV